LKFSSRCREKFPFSVKWKIKKNLEVVFMFKFLKEKIKKWTKKVSESKEKEVEDLEILPEVKEQIEKKVKEKKKRTEKEKESAKESKTPKKQGFFKKITSKITKVKISEKEFEIYANELEMLLLENNVALEVAEKIIKELKQRIVGKELLKKEVESEIKDSFKEIIREILIDPFDLPKAIKEKSSKDGPYVILFCGVNGTGKTTTIAKIADSLKNKGITSVLAAADTFRAASIEQIKKHGERVGVKVISHDYGSDPAAVAYDAIEYAKKHKINVVLIDTAGRMHTSKNLMAQIEKIAKVSKADTKIFVGESITGNDAIEQVKSFDWAIKIDGIILTKADIDEKGGTALSVGYVTKKPILYLGTGQEYNKIEPFDKQKFIWKLGLDD
jgi:fused signal recognition particle receptor